MQAAVRLEYARRGYRLFRNNSGALPDANGRLLRFGLGNDSPAVNAACKSSDLIGWRPVLVTPNMVGTCLAVFCSYEVKPPGWRLVPSDKRGQAQKAWIDLVVSDGGEGRFITGVDDQ